MRAVKLLYKEKVTDITEKKHLGGDKDSSFIVQIYEQVDNSYCPCIE